MKSLQISTANSEQEVWKISERCTWSTRWHIICWKTNLHSLSFAAGGHHSCFMWPRNKGRS